LPGGYDVPQILDPVGEVQNRRDVPRLGPGLESGWGGLKEGRVIRDRLEVADFPAVPVEGEVIEEGLHGLFFDIWIDDHVQIVRDAAAAEGDRFLPLVRVEEPGGQRDQPLSLARRQNPRLARREAAPPGQQPLGALKGGGARGAVAESGPFVPERLQGIPGCNFFYPQRRSFRHGQAAPRAGGTGRDTGRP
jgi:hypothetical protein